MTKQELVDHIAGEFNMPKCNAEKIVSAIMDRIHEGAARDGVCRVGKHIFKCVTRKARTCRNPRTGEAVNVPEKAFVVYRKPAAQA